MHVTVAPRIPGAQRQGPLDNYDREFPQTIGGADGSIVVFAYINDSSERLVVKAKATFPAITDGEPALKIVPWAEQGEQKG